MTGRALGVILAGGRSSRFGGNKALALFGGEPLIARVVARLRPQVDAMAISVQEATDFAGLSLPVFTDKVGGHQGPLAGVVAALVYARDGGFDELVTVPCDAPLLRNDLVSRLRSALREEDTDCAIAEVSGTPNAVFALYRVGTLEAIERIFRDGVRAPRDLEKHLGVAKASFTASEAADFRDVDTRSDLVAIRNERRS